MKTMTVNTMTVGTSTTDRAVFSVRTLAPMGAVQGRPLSAAGITGLMTEVGYPIGIDARPRRLDPAPGT